MTTYELIIKTLFGLEDVLQEELLALGAGKVQKLTRAVSCRGNLSFIYKCNLHLRTAIRVLRVIDTSTTYDEGRLYRNVKRIDWSSYIGKGQTFAIQAVTSGGIFTHSHYVALKTKDAIVDRFREDTGSRPSVDTKNPDILIHVHIKDRKCTISLDSSGENLGKRGYRIASTEAPLNEVLAAGLIKISGWDGHSDFIDPMCGSGTLPIEAAWLAMQRAPGHLREFAFQHWPGFDEQAWQEIKYQARQKEEPITCKIQGFDKNNVALEAAKSNATQAGVLSQIELKQRDFFQTSGTNSSTTLIMNPPYGERLEKNANIAEFYKQIGDHLKKGFTGADAWLFSANLEALKSVGLRAKKKVMLYNGPLESRFYFYPLYRGSRRRKKY